jgi:urease accessory protein
MKEDNLAFLRLLQLADSAVPIGAAAHSFGLETLVAEDMLDAPRLEPFLRDFLEETGTLEAVFCRAAHRLGAGDDGASSTTAWLDLNARLGALKPARESRAASATLGRRLLQLVATLEPHPHVHSALDAASSSGVDVHHAPAFGFAAGVLGIAEDPTVVAYLQQSTASLISACQRLFPLGQSEASRCLWRLKPALLAAAARGRDGDVEGAAAFACVPLIELAGMRHPGLETRLFIS